MATVKFRSNGRGRHVIDRRLDAYIRKALVDGAPAQVRPLLLDALSRGPDPFGAAKARSFFGEDLTPMLQRIGPLTDFVDDMMRRHMNVDGFKIWVQATGFGDDFRMIKAFNAWAELAGVQPNVPVVN